MSLLPRKISKAYLNSKPWKAAMAACNQGDCDTLRSLLLARLEKYPDDEAALTNLSVLYLREGKIKEGIALCEAGLAFHPNLFSLLVNIAGALCESRQYEKAYRYSARAIALDPTNPDALGNHAVACNRLGKIKEAEDIALQGLKHTPNSFGLLTALASAYKQQGKMEQAIALRKQALTVKPNEYLNHTNLLLDLLYYEQATVSDIVSSATHFADIFEKPFISTWQKHLNHPAPFRKVRIGFLSPDLNDHAVMYFVEPLLAGIDRDAFEVFCYDLHPKEDVVSERVRRYVDHYVVLQEGSVAEKAAIIRVDEIDVLIDLAGHTAKNGLPIMARKPAPVQWSWLGYPGTTGLKAIDWRLTDAIADAEIEGNLPLARQYSEQLIFIPPPFAVYRPSIRHLLQRYWPNYQVRPTPALKNGYITFGSCNNLAKLTPNTLQTWARILAQVPNAKLLIEGKGLQGDSTRDDFLQTCVDAGLPASRLILIPRDVSRQYLTYHDIDIALDPFPLTGGTTTYDVLWMGLPLVTMEGDSFRSRMSVDLLTVLGKQSWIANSVDAYVEIAVRIASDIKALNQARVAQRSMVEKSPLMDEPRFVFLFQKAMRQSWMVWCAKQANKDDWQAVFADYVKQAPKSAHHAQLVFLADGSRLPLSQAHGLLAQYFEQALLSATHNTTEIAGPREEWIPLIKLAQAVLQSIPNDSTALHAMAEADYAHGNWGMAVSYLWCAIEAAPEEVYFYQRLLSWCQTKGDMNKYQQVLTIAKHRGVKIA